MRKVAVLMGSQNDWDVMSEAVGALQEMGVEAVVEVISAHRSPGLITRFVRRAEKDGVAVFICGAGLAAHLAGAVAAQTTRPVLGVPLEAGSLRGLDALLSTVQMPPGVPVATFAIGKAGARNAGLFAAQVLALTEQALAGKLSAMKRSMETKVREASRAIREKRGRG